MRTREPKSLQEAKKEAKFYLGPDAMLKRANSNRALFENKKTGKTYRVQR